MAARKKRSGDPDTADFAEEFFDVEPPPQQQDLENLIDQLGSDDCFVDVHRVHDNNRRPFVDRVTVDVLKENPFEYIRSKWGHGKFLLYFRGPKFKYLGSKVVEIDPKVMGGAGVDGTQSAGASSLEQEHIRILREQSEKQQTLMMAMIAAQKGPDVGVMMQGIAALLGSANKAPAIDPAAMLTSVATVFATLRGPQKDEDWLSRAKTIIELAKDLQPEGKGEDTWFSVARDIGKEVLGKVQIPATAVTSINSAETVMPAEGMRPTPAAAGPAVEVHAQNIDITNPAHFAALLRSKIGYLKTRAFRGKDPEFFVEDIFENDDQLENIAIVGALRQGATFEQLLELDAEIGQTADLKMWFARLYDGLRRELLQSMDTAGPRGDVANTASHERPRAERQPESGSVAAGAGGAAPVIVG